MAEGAVADSAVAGGTTTGGANAADGAHAAPGDPLFGYIERFAAVLVSAGFPPMPARVFVALLVTDSGRLSAAEQAGLAAVLAQQSEQDADGGGFARAVRAEEGVHLAGPDGQVQAVQCGGSAERLAQRAHLDRVRHASILHSFHDVLNVTNTVC